MLERFISKPVLLTLLFHSLVVATNLHNITLPLPAGTSNHGTPGLLCTPSQWTDIISFFLLNYIAHAATVLTKPGENATDFAATVLGSLFFPTIGLCRGISAILSGAVFAKDDLGRAARSGALCMVVRGPEWRPSYGEEVKNTVLRRPTKSKDESDLESMESGKTPDSMHLVIYPAPWTFSKCGLPIYAKREVIHGIHHLPPGYIFAIVPPNTVFAAPSNPSSKIEIAATYSYVKALVALIQTAYTVMTLYKSRGDQITRYGWAAFGLTVAPYAVMSNMNLFGNLCRADYASLYMVESRVMDEARRRDGLFEGTIARVEEEEGARVCVGEGVEGEEMEDVEFMEGGDGGIVCCSASSSLHSLVQDSERPDMSDIKPSPTTSSSITRVSTQRTWKVLDLPPKLDYTATETLPILFIPSCNPLKLLPSSTTTSNQAPHYLIQKTALKRYTWFSKPRLWTLKFQHPFSRTHTHWFTLKLLTILSISLSPLLITGLISRFAHGNAPKNDLSLYKTWVMQWMISGALTGLGLVSDQEGYEARPMEVAGEKGVGKVRWRLVRYVVSAAPAVGGMVVVGKMVREYGVCSMLVD